MHTLNIAHRGASSLAPENTFTAFDMAIESRADGIEFDVQLSKDHIPVVIHDENLDRTTMGRGPVNKLTLAELKKLDAGSWFAPQFKNEKIPTLDEVLNKYKNSLEIFNIELKNSLIDYNGIEEAVLDCVCKNLLQDRVIISSFNHESLLTCRKINPAVKTGMLYLEEIKEPWKQAVSLGCYSAHPLFFYLQDANILAGYKKHGIPLYPWTVNDPEQMRYLVAEGVEAIITDYPQLLWETFKKAD